MRPAGSTSRRRWRPSPDFSSVLQRRLAHQSPSAGLVGDQQAGLRSSSADPRRTRRPRPCQKPSESGPPACAWRFPRAARSVRGSLPSRAGPSPSWRVIRSKDRRRLEMAADEVGDGVRNHHRQDDRIIPADLEHHEHRRHGRAQKAGEKRAHAHQRVGDPSGPVKPGKKSMLQRCPPPRPPSRR